MKTEIKSAVAAITATAAIGAAFGIALGSGLVFVPCLTITLAGIAALNSD